MRLLTILIPVLSMILPHAAYAVEAVEIFRHQFEGAEAIDHIYPVVDASGQVRVLLYSIGETSGAAVLLDSLNTASVDTIPVSGHQPTLAMGRITGDTLDIYASTSRPAYYAFNPQLVRIRAYNGIMERDSILPSEHVGDGYSTWQVQFVALNDLTKSGGDIGFSFRYLYYFSDITQGSTKWTEAQAYHVSWDISDAQFVAPLESFTFGDFTDDDTLEPAGYYNHVYERSHYPDHEQREGAVLAVDDRLSRNQLRAAANKVLSDDFSLALPGDELVFWGNINVLYPDSNLYSHVGCYRCSDDSIISVWQNSSPRYRPLGLFPARRLITATIPDQFQTRAAFASYETGQLVDSASLGRLLTHFDYFTLGERDEQLGAVGRVADTVFVYRFDTPTVTDDPDESPLPHSFTLHQNYPNPFNASTVIRFDNPIRRQVTAEVFNLLGQKVTTLLDEEVSAGQHTLNWNGRNTDGNPVASGVYLLRLTSEEKSSSIKMLYLQ